jgi:signal transduction histidine kinase
MQIDSTWMARATRRSYEPGDVIFDEGELGQRVFLVEDGHVAIVKSLQHGAPIVLGHRGPGDLIGEISLLSEGPRSASAVAIVPTIALELPREAFLELMREDASFQELVVRALLDHIRIADQSRVSAAVGERELFERLFRLSGENERLAALMQLRQETIHFIVHDLRNPLNLTRMALSMVEMTTPNKDEKTERFMAMASGGIQRMLGLVDAMLDVEKLEDGEASLDLDVIDMSTLIREVTERIQPMAWACKVELKIEDGSDSLPPLIGDRLRLDRVLTNLVDNAVKFLPPGGEIRVGAKSEGDNLRVWVNDTGLGIPADQRARIFERFVQTEAGRKSKGFGLGLAYCRSAVLAHHGQIWAEEGDGGKGTKFIIVLPLEQS